jgi:hypothetical protein
MREDIERMGGAWPPPGTREVERAVSVRPPVQDYERKARLLIERRKVMTAITDGRTLQRAQWRDKLQEIDNQLNNIR